MKKSPKHYLYGLHAVEAALRNPQRNLHRIYVQNEKMLHKISSVIKNRTIPITYENNLNTLVGDNAVHQGLVLSCEPLCQPDLNDAERWEGVNQRIIVLDQVTDPQNIGAILRSAAAFGAKAVILTDKHAPDESGALAKAASGALEITPLIRVTNLKRAIDYLKEVNFWFVGFAEEGEQCLHEIDLKGKIALLMGSEGTGLRRLTTESCDFTVRLETESAFTTLNVSTASAIALYEVYKKQKEK